MKLKKQWAQIEIKDHTPVLFLLVLKENKTKQLVAWYEILSNKGKEKVEQKRKHHRFISTVSSWRPGWTGNRDDGPPKQCRECNSRPISYGKNRDQEDWSRSLIVRPSLPALPFVFFPFQCRAAMIAFSSGPKGSIYFWPKRNI